MRDIILGGKTKIMNLITKIRRKTKSLRIAFLQVEYIRIVFNEHKSIMQNGELIMFLEVPIN